MNDISLLIAKVLRKFNFPIKLNVKYNDWRHKRILNKLNFYFIQASDNLSVETEENGSNKIWILWWQGEKNMPVLVKSCFDSIKNNSKNAEVILIDKDNVRNYADFPEYIYQKVSSGKISLTHFSDLLRFNLLKQYGGLWMDATLFVTDKLEDSIFEDDIYTCAGHEDKEHFFVTHGRWCGFFIGGKKNQPLFNFMNNFFLNYWKKNNDLIDYFMIDYALNYAWENNIGNFKYWCSKAIGRNKNMFKLQNYLNTPFNQKILTKLISNTSVFKLSYKKKLKNDPNSFYYKFILKEH